ncbi:unnamed protein product [Brachionus calyciflorus]|uniref:Integrase catalytic domain-containing protein n=1 Tax=Brachionus calyciflorus TaxID=104777 RepID=A0A814GLI1_9BILA|nr:unnamed protein product [Brachionus calyciflorus]
MLKLQELDYEILYYQGKLNFTADKLSRPPTETSNVEVKTLEYQANIDWEKEQENDKEIVRINVRANLKDEDYECLKFKEFLKKKFDKRWDLVSIDCADPLKRTKSGKIHFVIAVDYFSKYCMTEATIDTTEETTVNFASDRILIVFVTPQAFIKDQGRNFESQKFKYFCDQNKIKRQRTTLNVMALQKGPLEQKANALIRKYNERKSEEISNTLVALNKPLINVSAIDEEADINNQNLMQALVNNRPISVPKVTNNIEMNVNIILQPVIVEIDLNSKSDELNFDHNQPLNLASR